MKPLSKNTSRTYSKAELIYNRLRSLKERIDSLKNIEHRLVEVRKEIVHTEQRLYEIQISALEEIKCVSILILQIIQKNVPDSSILTTYAELLGQTNRWCK